MFCLSIAFFVLSLIIFIKNIEFSTLLKNHENSNIVLNESFVDKIVLTEDLFVHDNLNLTNLKKEKIQFLFNNSTIHSYNISVMIIFDNFNFILNNTNEKIYMILESSGTLIIKVSFYFIQVQ